MRRAGRALAAGLALAAAPARAVPSPPPPVAPAPFTVTLAAPGATRTLDRAALDAMPAGPAVVLDGRHGEERYAGPLLWNVLEGAGLVPADMRVRARETVAVTGADGYVAAFALAELDPGFAGAGILLATTGDGRRLARPRVAVPGDRARSRDVRDVVSIRIVPGA